MDDSKRSQNGSISEENPANVVDGPDTSSFSAFLYSLLSSSESGDTNKNSDEQIDDQMDRSNPSSDSAMKGNGGKRSLLSKGKQSLSKVMFQAARFGGYRSQERKGNPDMKVDDANDSNFTRVEIRPMQKAPTPVPLVDHPDISEPSLLLTEITRTALYASMPALVQGRKWLLLYRYTGIFICSITVRSFESFYFIIPMQHCTNVFLVSCSTWRHGISLSTLYRRSMLWPGLSLLVIINQTISIIHFNKFLYDHF